MIRHKYVYRRDYLAAYCSDRLNDILHRGIPIDATCILNAPIESKDQAIKALNEEIFRKDNVVYVNFKAK